MKPFNYPKRILAAALAALCLAGASAMTPAEAFVSAPRQIFPLLDRNARLDMIDYFNSGMSTRTANALNGTSAVTAMTPSTITVEMTSASTVELVVLPCGNDTVVAVISTVKTPAPDSKIAVCSSDWKKTLTPQFFSKPELKDWLTDDGRRNRGEVESFVPFLLISYAYDPSASTLTLTNNTREFLSDDVYAIVEPFLKQTIVYRWNGKRFAVTK